MSGGRVNVVHGSDSTVGGGNGNTTLNAANATIGGGFGHDIAAFADWATIGGGQTNSATNVCSTVGGGINNTVQAGSATVAGGNGNQATAFAATVAGGSNCDADGQYSFSVGQDSEANNDWSFALGKQAIANHDGAFVWADQSVAGAFTSTAMDQFIVRTDNGFGINTATTNTAALSVFSDGQSTLMLNRDTSAGTMIEFRRDNATIGSIVGSDGVIIRSNAGVGVNSNITDTAALTVFSDGQSTAVLNRDNSDGVLVDFRRDNTTIGDITVAAGTVTYNAFTGSHLGWTTAEMEHGMLAAMTGVNRYRSGDAGEPIYGIVPSAQANDPKILGAYLTSHETSSADPSRHAHLVMAVGNGDMWVAEAGEDIAPGDYLISSSVAGHAMKDTGEYDVSYIVARAAEPLAWEEVTETIDGVKHRKISVFFESFARNHAQERTREELESLKLQVAELSRTLQQLVEERGSKEEPTLTAMK